MATRTPDLYRVKVDSAHWRGEMRPATSGLDLVRPQVNAKPRPVPPGGESLLKQRDLGPPHFRGDLVCHPKPLPPPFGPRGTSPTSRRQMAPDGTPENFIKDRGRAALLSAELAMRRTGSESARIWGHLRTFRGHTSCSRATPSIPFCSSLVLLRR